MKTAHVIFASDDNGAKQLAVALHSLLATHDFSRHGLRVSVLNGQTAFSFESRSRFESVVAGFDGAEFEILDIDPLLEEYRSVFERRTAWPMIAWGRCFISKLFPEESGAIVYLDIDTLVAHDLSFLYDLDFDLGRTRPAMLAAVYEDSREIGAGCPPWSNGVMPEESSLYFNSGALVFNAAAFRDENALDMLAGWYRRNAERAICPDQDALNAVFWDRVIELPLRYNYSDGWLERFVKFRLTQPRWRASRPIDVLEAVTDPYVLHFWGPRKPWRANHRPEGSRYEKAMAAVGLHPGVLPGTTIATRIQALFFGCYHAWLRCRAARLLENLKRKSSS